MKYYPKFIALAILIAIILAIIVLNRHFHSPTFQAHRLLAELRMVDEPLNEISETLMDIGFIAGVERRRPAEIIAEYVILGEPAVLILLPALDDDNENVRDMVADILIEMGPQAQSAVPYLIQKIIDTQDHVRQVVFANILGGIDVPAVPALLELVARGSEKEKLLAAIALAQIDHNLVDNELTQLYLDSLSRQDRNARLLALNIVTILGPDASDAAGVDKALMKYWSTRYTGLGH